MQYICALWLFKFTIKKNAFFRISIYTSWYTNDDYKNAAGHPEQLSHNTTRLYGGAKYYYYLFIYVYKYTCGNCFLIAHMLTDFFLYDFYFYKVFGKKYWSVFCKANEENILFKY